MKLSVIPKEVFILNLCIIFLLLFANLFGIFTKDYTDSYIITSINRIFDFNKEGNIPTFFSSLMLIFASVLLLLITTCYKKLKSPYFAWLGLSIIFLFLAIDEIASIHEQLNWIGSAMVETTGFLAYGWVIPYGILSIFFITVYAKFLFNLPRRSMIFFILSGTIFLSGALGLEMVGGRTHELYQSQETIQYALLYTGEEFLEMLGVALFIYSLLRHIVIELDFLSLTITEHS